MADATTCSLCRLPGADIQAGGDLGAAHFACFVAWDQADEAEEHQQLQVRSTFPLPMERRRRAGRAVEVACG